MQCPICSGKKPLSLQKKDPGFDGPFPSCKQCGVLISSKTGFFQCDSCKFALCPNCKICKKNHLLQRVYDLSSFGYANYKTNNYCCDGCGSHRVNFKEIGVYHCRPCRFDLCDKCTRTAVTKYPSSHKDSVVGDSSKSPEKLEDPKKEPGVKWITKKSLVHHLKMAEQPISDDDESVELGLIF